MMSIRLSIVFIASLILSGCGSTSSVTSQWLSNSVENRVLKKTIVVANVKNPEVRRKAEDAFVNALQENGVMAYSAYAQGIVDQKSLEDKTSELSITDIMTLSISSVNDEVFQSAPVYGYGLYGFGGLYSFPPTDYVQEDVTSRVSIYDLTRNAYLWMATIDTIPNGQGVNTLIDNGVTTVLEKMKTDGLIK